MSNTNWNLDTAHSEVNFKVKHMMITNVNGSFKDFNLTATSNGDDFSKANVHFTAQAASVNTGNEQRDGHLRSPEFFDAEKFPEVTFKATNIEKKDSENYTLHGDLTMHGVTKNIALNAEHGGIGKDPWGNIKTGFTVTGTIHRKDFGLNWNAALETGGVMVSDDVKINCEIQLIKSA